MGLPLPSIQTVRAESIREVSFLWEKLVFLSRMDRIWYFCFSLTFLSEATVPAKVRVCRGRGLVPSRERLPLGYLQTLGSGKSGLSQLEGPLTSRLNVKPESSIAVLHFRNTCNRSYRRFPTVQRKVVKAAECGGWGPLPSRPAGQPLLGGDPQGCPGPKARDPLTTSKGMLLFFRQQIMLEHFKTSF